MDVQGDQGARVAERGNAGPGSSRPRSFSPCPQPNPHLACSPAVGGSPSQIAMTVFGALLLLGLATWLIDSFVESPSRFTQVTLIGFTNGAIFALVALGYTLVYGIIELINFAHGDNFMLGTFQTQSIIVDGSFQIPLLFFVIAIPLGTAVTATSSPGARIRDRGVAPARDGLLHGDQRLDRADRLPAAAQPAAPRAADHRDRLLVHPPERRPRLEGPGPGADPGHPSEGEPLRLERRPLLVQGPDRGRADDPAPDRAPAARAAHEGRQGDARDGAGPGRLGDDGDQRRPHDLVYVPHSAAHWPEPPA